MKLPRRQFLHLAVGAVALPAVARPAWGQAYPARPVRLMVGFAPGGGTDFAGRLMAQWLSERTGQQFFVENRPGAATNIATEAVVRSTPDGYTLLTVHPANTANATLYNNLNFNFIRDIAPVAGLMHQPLILVANPSVPVKTVPELIAYAKANPGKITMGTNGIGSESQLSGEMFKLMAGVDMTPVPYRGTGLAVVGLLGGQLDVMFNSPHGVLEHVKAGELRALAQTGAARSDVLPDVPTVGEFVPGYETSIWFGVGAPAGTPVDVIDKLNREINAGLADAKIKARLAEAIGVPMPMTPAGFGKFIADETEKWAKVIRAANIKAG
jgi:tripartite-type tricarboxylate transporter receptor subunit TctC